MSTIVSNLYPPIVENAMPSFIRTGPCRVYFSLSSYNNIQDIKNVQVTVVNQTNNKSVLKTSLYPSGIKITNLNQDQTVTNEYKYYIIINPADIVNNEFEKQIFYMVQLRFTSIDVPQDPPSGNSGLNTWLYEYTDYFSEWSTICLIKGINQPILSLTGFNPQQTVTFNALTRINGKIYYVKEDNPTKLDKSKEFLKSFKFQIILNNRIIYETNEIYTNSYSLNLINYDLNILLEEANNYILRFTYKTTNGYTQTKTYSFNINKQSKSELEGNIFLSSDSENGRIKIEINFEQNITRTNKNLILKRSSSKTNFSIWEKIKTIPNASNYLKHIFYDTSIESGVWYKYYIQQQTIDGTGRVLEFNEPIMCTFEHMYLTTGDKQLKIQFNPSLTAFKYNLLESQQVTLGSQYPYIKRNGNAYYRTFSISGLITALIDEDSWYNPHFQNGSFNTNNTNIQSFSSVEEIYGKNKDLYAQYNSDNNINIYNDMIYEKEFRQKVIDFLYKNNIKLFRSNTEGNILVKLMDILLEPTQELNRRLYSFSANAIEIDDLTETNYDKYNIINTYIYNCHYNELNATFQRKESILTKIVSQPNFLNYGETLLNINKITFQVATETAVNLLVKTENSESATSYTILNNNPITVEFDENNPIEDCWFNTGNISADITCYYTVKRKTDSSVVSID